MKVLPASALTIGVALALISLSGCGRQEPTAMAQVDLAACLSDLTNVAKFAETPAGVMHFESTYDRSGGNSDWRILVDKDKQGLYTLADLKGPGCVRRFWFTGIGEQATLHFFFDGEKEPSFEGTPSEICGKLGSFRPPLCDYLSGGFYFYMPLPFADSLRIAVSGPITPDWHNFYHVNYETYGPGVRVASYPKTLSSAESKLWGNVQSDWREQSKEAIRTAEACTQVSSRVVLPGQSVTWLQQNGPAVLSGFRLQVGDSPATSALARARRLREVVLRIYWDGAAEPSVDVPIGDFFCNGLHRRRFASLPLAVLDQAMVCRFPMPFRKSIRVELRNDGRFPVSVEAGWNLRPLTADKERDINYFHAAWNSSTQPGMPHRVLRAEGKGHYVGCYLIANGSDGTWNMLEGDESMYLNGEMTASLHGTGLEDYFNGGWYYWGPFERPLHGLLEKAGMQTAQYRFHLSDPVAFQNGFLMNWEFGDGNRSQGYMSSVAYWYQPEPHPAGTRLPDVGRRLPPDDPLELSLVMSGLFGLDRLGLYDETSERCMYFAEKYSGHEFAPVLRLRSAAYRELSQGFEAVRSDYEATAKSAPESEAGREARWLLWFHEAESNALVGVHANARYRIYLDGRPLLEGQDAFRLAVTNATILPGEHELTAEVTPIRSGSWFSMGLRTSATNLSTDGTWEYVKERPASWPSSGGGTGEWSTVADGGVMLPLMAWWQFVPNAYVRMQGGKQLIQPAWNGWEQRLGITTYLRKRFVIPAAGK